MQKTISDTPPIIKRKDYRPPDWLVPKVALDFKLGLHQTTVRATLQMTRQGTHTHPIRLDHDDVVPTRILVDGVETQWTAHDGQIIVECQADEAEIILDCTITPYRNTQLMGLYSSNGMLCTQCEAEGFRRIIPFVDRPDNLSIYTVKMRGPKASFPVLLCNGDLVETGEGADADHYAIWHDPWPKPSYLFALVAGDLVVNRDMFTTMSGREVELGIWVRDGDLPRTGHAMAALKKSMAWDEQIYGREYDLDLFNIVAVSDFNMGAMENKGLNVFNSRYILADPEVATDADYDAIEGVVAHEYFHNWSGNRVTCRDWFQLSLKEGFTVYRDQSFSADMGSAALKRIEDVRILRAAQFPEDAGPLAHPIRPESYMEISNFYTATVYNKGAEIIRMMATLMGAENFRKGTDLYFDRHDGEAATCEDFIRAIEEGGDIDLTQYRAWYSTAGTPQVSAKLDHDGNTASTRLTLSQNLIDKDGKAVPSNMVIPLRTALLNSQDGQHGGEDMLVLDTAEKTFEFAGHSAPPILSLNRGFSAPIIVRANQSAKDLAFLSAHDDDAFNRFEAMQQLCTQYLLSDITGGAPDTDLVFKAFSGVLADEKLDRAMLAEIVTLPSEAFLGDQMPVVDPTAIFEARRRLHHDIAVRFHDDFQRHYQACTPHGFTLSIEDKAKRRLRNIALAYLCNADAKSGAAMALKQFEQADNMTAKQGALSALSALEEEERITAFDSFYNAFHHNALVLDKWFGLQAMAPRADTLNIIKKLAAHKDFTLSNPNRVRALYGSFAANQRYFHDPSGQGYAMLADLIIALDKQNPQTAARLIAPLGRWRRYIPDLSAQMKAALERIQAEPGLSKDCLEQASKSLGQ